MPEITHSSLFQRAQAIMPDLIRKQFERNREVLVDRVLKIDHNLLFHLARNEEFAGRRDYLT